MYIYIHMYIHTYIYTCIHIYRYIYLYMCVYVYMCLSIYVRCIHMYTSVQSVQFSCSVVSDSLRPHESQHARPPSPSQTPGVYSNSCPSSWWCHPAISRRWLIQTSRRGLVPFSSCPQSIQASGSFPVSQLFAWGSQSIGVSALASVLPMNTQDWSPLGWTGWISLQSKGLSKESSPTPQFKSVNFSALSFLHSPTLTSIHDHWKNYSLDQTTFVGKVMSLHFNMLSRLVITFLSRRKRLLISWLQSPSAVILEPPKLKSATVAPSISHEVMGPDAMILVFWMLSFKPTFSTLLFHFHQEAF